MGKLTIQRKEDAGRAILKLDGRLDTNTSLDLQEALDKEWETPHDITLDFESLSYMSSAGLRVILSTQKKATAQNTDFRLVNVSEPVLEVLDVVGFLEFIQVD
ncbi:STAS domain-containing protein [Christensenellaceae bacterium OttesenSCG-928-K19]|nr:STAS domain-containing protein [Christensenellaceae bacterium OttesenSCG-928-K19]